MFGKFCRALIMGIVFVLGLPMYLFTALFVAVYEVWYRIAFGEWYWQETIEELKPLFKETWNITKAAING